MRKYRKSASSAVRVAYGIELAEGLRQFPETAHLADSFAAMNEALAAQLDKRLGLEKPLAEARVRLRFAEYHADQCIRSAARAAEIADGGRRGRIAAAVFPEGLTPVVAPTGRRQIEPMRELVGNLEHSRLPSLDAYRAEWQPRLAESLARLEDAAAAFHAASDAVARAFAEETALREVHEHEVDRVIGLVRAAFPRDKVRQDLVFPILAAHVEPMPI
jgi:hypothetical protein